MRHRPILDSVYLLCGKRLPLSDRMTFVAGEEMVPWVRPRIDVYATGYSGETVCRECSERDEEWLVLVARYMDVFPSEMDGWSKH